MSIVIYFMDIPYKGQLRWTILVSTIDNIVQEKIRDCGQLSPVMADDGNSYIRLGRMMNFAMSHTV